MYQAYYRWLTMTVVSALHALHAAGVWRIQSDAVLLNQHRLPAYLFMHVGVHAPHLIAVPSRL